MNINAKALADKRIAEIKAQAAKNKTVKTPLDKEEKNLEASFFKALARKDSASLSSISEEVAKEYQAKGQTVGTNADGGFLVPETLEASIIEKLNSVSTLRGVATTMTMDTPSYKLNIEATEPTSYWVDEEATITESKQTFAQDTLEAHKLAALAGFSSESLEDAVSNPSMRDFVIGRFARSMARLENDAFVNGNGTGKPFGFTTMTPGATMASAASTTADNIKSLYRLLGEDYRASATFLMNDFAVGVVDKLKDGNGRYIWTDGGGLENHNDRLLGANVLTNKAIATVTAATTMWFGDFSYYMIGDYAGLRIDTGTNGTDFAKDRISVRMTKRVAGKTLLPEAFASMTAVK